MRPRVRVPPCRFCAKTFRRTEHLRRHERTHTKEKPFACKCGRSFSRSDLLARHDRLAHGQEDPNLTTSNKEQAVLVSQTHEAEERSRLIESGGNSPHASPIGVGSNAHSHDPVHVQRGQQPEPFLPNSSAFASTPTAATSSFEGTLPMPCHPMQDPSLPAPLPSLDFDQQQVQTTDFMDQPPWELSLGDDLDFLWNDIEVHSARDLVQSFAMNYSMNFQLSMPPDDVFNPGAAMFNDAQGGNDDLQPDSGALSRFGSRLPSVQPSGADTRHHASDPPQASPAANGRLLQPPPTSDKVNVPWRLSKAEYCLIHDIIRDRRSVLPSDFVMPSRHALCRYIEGYFSGFHEHLPFVHLPTISLATESPELILAIASTGARYRFQRRQAHHLYLAARAVLGEQLRLRDECALPGSVFSTLGSLCDGSISSLSPPSLLNASGRPKTAADCQPHSTAESIRRDVRTMQAMIILIAMGTWNHRSLIKDAFATASQLALLVREDGLDVSDFQPAHLTWDEWVIAEGRRRTKLVAFCFLNLHCIVSNSPPKLMNTDVGSLHLPCPESHWKATDEHEWAAARKKHQHTELSVQKGYSCLFTRPADAQADDTISSFGNYVLIHCLVQQIFFNRQSTLHFGESRSASLPTEALTKLESALRVWQQNWEATQDSSLDPSAPGGPLSFNSTALFRLAYLRLHADFGPCRQLETRDARSIARAFHNAGLLERSSCVNRAILQSAHSLSIPVRIGIEFVARTQTLNWSIVHSLCNLECALFLGKWLETIASALHRCEPLEEDEKRLLGIVASIISETDLGLGLKLETDAVRRTRTMAVAVIRLWAFTFKGAHVFDIMGTIGAGLDLCADMLQQELDVPPS